MEIIRYFLRNSNDLQIVAVIQLSRLDCMKLTRH
jgi:hypothetical protein